MSIQRNRKATKLVTKSLLDSQANTPIKATKSNTKVALGLEMLEDRVTPTTYVVNTTALTNTGTGNVGDFDYVVGKVNGDTTKNSGTDTIVFDTGVFNGSQGAIFLNSTYKNFSITRTQDEGAVVIQAGTSQKVTFDGAGAYSPLSLNANVDLTLDGLTIQNGLNSSQTGGAINSAGNLTVQNCTFTNDIAASTSSAAGTGGAIYNTGGLLTVTNSTFTNNNAQSSSGDTALGGAIYSTASLQVTGSTFSNNFAGSTLGGTGDGGAIYCASTSLVISVTLSKDTFTSNVASNFSGQFGIAGAIYCSGITGTTVQSAGSTYTSNTANANTTGVAEAGAIYDNGNFTSTGDTFSGNLAGSTSVAGGAGEGGALFITGTTNVSGGSFSGNEAGSSVLVGGIGGAIYSGSSLTLNSSTLKNNLVTSTGTEIAYGGGAYTLGAVTIDNSSMITGNVAGVAGTGTGYGGAIYESNKVGVFSGNVVSSSTISNNTANASSAGGVAGASLGGGLYLDNTITTISTGTFTSNLANGAGFSGGNGGAIYTTGDLVLSGNSFTKNSALVSFKKPLINGFGGAIYSLGGIVSSIDTFTSNSSGQSGGAIYENNAVANAKVLSIRNDTLTFNTSGLNGGAIDTTIGSVIFDPTIAQNNTAAFDGGVLAVEDALSLTVSPNDMSNNTATDPIYSAGGAIWTGTSEVATTVTNTSFTHDSASSGGAIYSNGSLTLTGVNISNDSGNLNYSGAHGGGIVVLNTLNITNSSFNNDSAYSGGAIFLDYSNQQFLSTISGSNVSNNQANSSGNGGGLATTYHYVADPFTYDTVISNVTFSTNSAGNGGAIYSLSSLSLSNVQVVSNTATGNGGGVYLNTNSSPMQNALFSNSTIQNNSANVGGGIWNGLSLTLTTTPVTQNTATMGGGGVANQGNLTLLSNVISNNTVTSNNNSSTYGGGIYDFGIGSSFTITGSQINSNTANFGAGVYAVNAGPLLLTNSTLTSDNTSSNAGAADQNWYKNAGAAIYLYTSNLTINDATIVDNQSLLVPSGSGIYLDGSVLTMNNTILSDNTVAGSNTEDDMISLNGTIIKGGYNIIGAGELGPLVNGVNGNQIGITSLGLGAFTSNGGPTQTFALQSSSPALNAGSVALIPTGVTTDQRGQPRVVNNSVDIGAYESAGYALTLTGGNTQATTVNTAFSVPLQVNLQVLDPALGSLSGKSITFKVQAGANGASGTLSSYAPVTDATGTVQVIATANGIVGSFTVTASIGSTSVTFTLFNTAAGSSGGGSGGGSGSGSGSSGGNPNQILYAVAAAQGSPRVNVYNGLNQMIASFYAFDPIFHVGVTVAVADVNGDGTPDIIVGAGPGGGPQVIVIDGTKLNQVSANGEIAPSALISSFYAFEPSFTGGVNVAAGNFEAGINRDQIVVGAGPGGGPRVVVIDPLSGQMLQSFYAFESTFSGGVNVAASDLFNQGVAQIIAGAGAGGGPRVTVFNGMTGQMMESFYAFNPLFTGGVFVAAGDGDIVVSTGATPMINQPNYVPTASQPVLGPLVNIFNPSSQQMIASFDAYQSSFLGGVHVAVHGTQLITGVGTGGGPNVKEFDLTNLNQLNSFFAFESTFAGGVFVG